MDKKKQKNNKMTIDGLATLMVQGFSKIDKKLETNQEFMAIMVKNAFQSNQEYMDKKFGVIDEKFNAIDEKFDVIGEDLRHVHYKLDTIDKKFDGQEKTIFNHDSRIDKLEVDTKKVKKILAI